MRVSGRKGGQNGDLIEAIKRGLPDGVEMDEREEALLALAAAQSADIERAEAVSRSAATSCPAPVASKS